MGNKLDHPNLELPPEKLVMVTGGNTGIGYETAKSVAEMGAKVCIACRSEDKAKAAIERMQTEHRDEVHKRNLAQTQAQHPNGAEAHQPEEAEVRPLNLEYITLDLSSLQSTMDFIQEAKQRMSSLNVLVCNAGIAFAKQGYTADNFESHFQINYLSHVLVIIHLMPLLRAGAPDSRIVLLSSATHSNGKLDLDNMQGQKSYGRIMAYSSSKAYNVMATHFLARRLEGTGVSTYSVDPGSVDTQIAQSWNLLNYIAGAMGKMGMLRTPKQGAATSVVACVDPALCGKTGVFLKNCRPADHASFCHDEGKQEMLWNYSLKCLDKFICDDVLKEAFPSAKPDLLIIPKETRTVEEKIADDLAKQGSSDNEKKMGEQSNGTSPEEQQPERKSSSVAAEIPSEMPKTSQEPEGEKSAEDEVRGDEISFEKKQLEKLATEELSSAAVELPSEMPKMSQEPEGVKSADEARGDEIYSEKKLLEKLATEEESVAVAAEALPEIPNMSQEPGGEKLMPKEDSSEMASEASEVGVGLTERKDKLRQTEDAASAVFAVKKQSESQDEVPRDGSLPDNTDTSSPAAVVITEDVSIRLEDSEKPTELTKQQQDG